MASAASPRDRSVRVGDGRGCVASQSELYDVACQELAEVCGVVNAGHGRMVRLMADVLADDVWAGVGLHSPHHWLTWKTSLSRQSASAVVNLARRSIALDATVTALCEGRLSLESAGLIARYVPDEYESSALELAAVATVSQLRRSVSRYHFDIEQPEPEPDPAPGAGGGDDNEDHKSSTPGGAGPASEQPDAQEEQTEAAARGGDRSSSGSCCAGSCGHHRPTGMQGGRHVWPWGRPVEERSELSMGYGENGWSASIHLPDDLAAAFETAVRARRDDLYRRAEKELGPKDPRPKVTLVDALMSLVEGALADGAATAPGTDRYLIHAHLTGAPGGGNALNLHLGATLPDHLRRLYTCDGTIRPVLETDGIPVNIGRLQRIVSRRVRRLIEHRDGGCAVPGCEKRHGLEVHHVWHWEDGGLTTTDNLLTLCRMHHRLHHLGRIHIWGNADGPRYTPDGVQFADSSGRMLAPVGAAIPVASGHSLETSARKVGIEPVGFDPALGERIDYSQVFFSRRRTAHPGAPPGPSRGRTSGGSSPNRGDPSPDGERPNGANLDGASSGGAGPTQARGPSASEAPEVPRTSGAEGSSPGVEPASSPPVRTESLRGRSRPGRPPAPPLPGSADGSEPGLAESA